MCGSIGLRTLAMKPKSTTNTKHGGHVTCVHPPPLKKEEEKTKNKKKKKEKEKDNSGIYVKVNNFCAGL